jgi:hypothetical protein
VVAATVNRVVVLYLQQALQVLLQLQKMASQPLLTRVLSLMQLCRV